MLVVFQVKEGDGNKGEFIMSCDKNKNPGNCKAILHLEVRVEHGISRKIVLKNV